MFILQVGSVSNVRVPEDCWVPLLPLLMMYFSVVLLSDIYELSMGGIISYSLNLEPSNKFTLQIISVSPNVIMIVKERYRE